jgi:hypothetical protein
MSLTIPHLPQWEQPPAFKLENVQPLPQSIRAVPNDVLKLIFRLINEDKDICNLELVCKEFYRISRTYDQIWGMRFQLRWPLIKMYPSEPSQTQFKLFRYHLGQINEEYTVKQLREEISQSPEKAVRAAYNQYIAAIIKSTGCFPVAFGAFFPPATSRQNLTNSEQVKLMEEAEKAKKLYESEKSKYESSKGTKFDETDASSKTYLLERHSDMIEMITTGVSSKGIKLPPSVYLTLIIEKAKKRVKGKQLDYHFEVQFQSICATRIRVLQSQPLVENQREIEFLQKAQKSHQSAEKALKIKHNMNDWIRMFKIPLEWQTLPQEHRERFSKLCNGEVSLLSLESHCPCCKEGKSPSQPQHDSSSS